jgi:hypothetical protein
VTSPNSAGATASAAPMRQGVPQHSSASTVRTGQGEGRREGRAGVTSSAVTGSSFVYYGRRFQQLKLIETRRVSYNTPFRAKAFIRNAFDSEILKNSSDHTNHQRDRRETSVRERKQDALGT